MNKNDKLIKDLRFMLINKSGNLGYNIIEETLIETLIEEVSYIKQSRSDYDKSMRKKYYKKYKDGSFSTELREEYKEQKRKEVENIKHSLSIETAMHKKVAAEKINEVELLKSDIRRLEKIFKTVSDENIRLNNILTG